ncbi:hypothetical protein KI688_000294 [Linnemannia hyalina]|uniref:Uncharacterized protein n=1 Tax=Linnemannia hyalina TaxID=64524 RepID=A0A9P7Y602_9FUNG|nr:hypothetical protein KI688_000294 [Linnemannia hyalina]
MGRRLSLLCCPCLPRKQRDNLSSRSLYPDQDSSGHDDYSDEDDYYPSHARLESLAPSSSSSSQPYSNNNSPWPSGLSNGRFSKQSSRGSHQRKPNPFRTPYHDDNDEEGDGREAGDGASNGGGSGGGVIRDKGVGITSFAPYRDDSGSDNGGSGSGAEAEGEEREDRRLRRELRMGGSGEPKDESTSNDHGHGGSALQNPTRVHAKMDVSPYRIFDSSSSTTTTTTRVRSARPPRNPQGKMRWHDGDISSDNEDGEVDAEEVIDVDALIAEQERITRELAAQEEALRREEEAAILSKRLAAIRAAEKRGLLRFEGDRLVIPNSDSNNNMTSTITKSKSITIPSQSRTVQEHDGEGKQQRLARERTTSSGASSFVGGVDAFNQELKMMDLDMSASRSTEKTAARPSTITTTTSTSTSRSTSTSTSTNTGPSLRGAVSTGVSTSMSTSTNSTPTVAINPREVFNNITSFLKKVDGVIAGESDSSDEATISDQEQVLGKGRAKLARGPQESRVHGPEETGALKSKVVVAGTVEAPTVQRAATPVPFDAANQGEDDDNNEQPYPEDPFNTQTSDPLDDNNNSRSRRDPHASKERITPDSPGAEKKETAGETKHKAAALPEPASPVSPVSPIYGHLSESVAAVVPERVFSTFTSLFNSGSSFMGLWGTGGVGAGGAGDDDDDGRGTNGGVAADGRRLSDLKYGDPKKHRFNYQDHHNTLATGASTAKRVDDDDNSSIDDYDF